MTAPPSQQAACWAQHACLVLSCLVGPGAVAVSLYPGTVPQLSYRRLLGPDRLQYVSILSIHTSIHPYAQLSAILSCPDCIHSAQSVVSLPAPPCCSCNGIGAGCRVQSPRAKGHASSVMSCHALPLLFMPVLGERRGGKSSTSCAVRVCGLSLVDCNCSTACRYRYPRCWVWDQYRGTLQHVRTGYSTCVIVRLNLGGPICKVVLLIQSCLGMAWAAHGMGCTRAELHVGQVQGRSVAASQARRLAGLQSGRARVGGVCHHRASSVGCLYPMPGLLGLLALLVWSACCGLLAARPRAARCVSRSWSIANPAN